MGYEVRFTGKRLGDILLEEGLVTRQQLEEAASLQRVSGTRLGRALIELGYLDELDLARALAHQLELPFVRLQEIRLEPEVARLVPEQTARRCQAIPITRRNGSVVVAMADPLNVLAVDELGYLTGAPVEVVVMTQKDVERAIEAVYHGVRGPEAEPPFPFAVAEAGEPAESAPAVRLANSIIQRALEERATDIHIELQAEYLRVRYRVDGVLHEAMTQPKDVHSPLVTRLKLLASLDISEHRVPQDGRILWRHEGRDVDLRLSTLPTIQGEKVVIRILDRAQQKARLEELGLGSRDLAVFRSMIHKPYGLVLVTGPTGSGKSTTLNAALRELNDPGKNIITVEDPVEYTIPGVNHVQVNPKAGITFASGLRAILRQDPNIIMVGEIRDSETADIAVRSALTGHLVLSTLHTNDAAGAVSRLLDMGVEAFLIASSLVGVVAQRLARTICPRCKTGRELTPSGAERYASLLPPPPVQVYEGKGCAACNRTGYRGRTGLFEVLEVTPAIRELVSGKKPAYLIREEAMKGGMRPLLQDGVEKALAGITTLDEVMRVAFAE